MHQRPITMKPFIDGTVNATSPNPITNKEFSLALAKVLHKPCFLKSLEFVFKLIFGQMAEEIMLDGQKVLPEKAMRYGFEFCYTTIQQSLSKILRA
jgi:NAD dependent epimerase/dehydratase family enzyme